MKNIFKVFLLLPLLLNSSLFGKEAFGIKDFLNKEILVTKAPKKGVITCYGGAVQQIAIFAKSDFIIAHPKSESFPFFKKLFPMLANKKSIGTFNDINLEKLLKINPDIVFAGSTSIETNNKIEKLGIPVYTMGIGKHSLKSLLAEFDNMGKLFLEKEKAQELIEYWQLKLKEVESQTESIKHRKKVFYASGSSEISSENKDWWGDVFITKSGGINVANKMEAKGTISIEKIILWNPDVIILPSNRTLKTTAKDFLNKPQFGSITAVKNKEIHMVPVAGFWWDRPSPEAILGIMWLSKVLYPEEMKYLDLKKESKFFYEKFYNYKLTADEYEGFLNGLSSLKNY